MILIQKLNRPNKRSGDLLAPGQTFNKKGIKIINMNGGKGVYVDVFTSPAPKKKARKKK